MARVHALWEDKRQRLFLKCALTARDASLLQIADWCCTTPVVVLLFTRLCWNIRARWDDRAFMTQLLQLDHLYPPAFGGEVDGLELVSAQELPFLRVTYRLGIGGLFKALRIPVESPPADQEKSLTEIREEAGRVALAGVLHGLHSVENNAAMELLQMLGTMERKDGAPNRPEDEKMGLMALSEDESAQRTLKSLIMAGAEERLKLARQFDEEAVRKKILNGSSTDRPPGPHDR